MTKKIFTPPPFVSFKSAINLRSHLVRSKIYPLVSVIVSTKCQNKRCQVCYNVRETDCSQSYHLNSEYKINHKFHCNDKCWVYYLLTWKVCWKEQYVEETVDRFRLRWKNNSFLNDIVIILLIRLTQLLLSEPTRRKHFLIRIMVLTLVKLYNDLYSMF